MVTVPVVNINGSPLRRLALQQNDVLNQLLALKIVMAEAFPHGRDFQTAPEGTYAKARAEALARDAKVNELFVEYQDLMAGILEQEK